MKVLSVRNVASVHMRKELIKKVLAENRQLI